MRKRDLHIISDIPSETGGIRILGKANPLAFKSLEEWSHKYYWIITGVVILICVFNVFYRLDSEHVKDWDEARYGTTAYEMIKNHDWILTTYSDKPDYWVLKPPLGYWAIAISCKIFGFTPFALRFSSALATVLTLIILMLMARRYAGSWMALLTGMVFSTLHAVIHVHAGRSGDFDAGVSFFLALTALLLMIGPRWPVSLALLGLVAGSFFLLKSFVVIFSLALAGLFLLISGRWRKYPWPIYLFGLCFFILPIALWGFARYQVDHWAFFKKMISYDLFGTVQRVLEKHDENVWYYPKIILRHHYDWLCVLFLSLVVNAYFFLRRWKRQRAPLKEWWGRFRSSSGMLFLLWGVLPILIPTWMRTKLAWYINPMYPALAFFIAWLWCRALKANDQRFGKTSARSSVLLIFFLIVLVAAEGRIIYHIEHRVRPQSDQALLRDIKPIFTPGSVIYSTDWNQGILFTARVVLASGTEKTISVESFIQEALAGSYLLAKRNFGSFQRTELQTIAANKHYVIYRKVQN